MTIKLNETTEIANTHSLDPKILENIVLNGDLSRLAPIEKVQYYNAFCEKLNLNPLTKPFQLIKFQGKEILYPTKDATEQLRKINGVSVTNLDTKIIEGIYIVTAFVEDKTKRTDTATGVIAIHNLKGDALANAMMKAETKAKRRATLSICGLGMMDDSETDTIGAYKKVDIQTGEVIEAKAERESTSPNIDRIAILKQQLRELYNQQTLSEEDGKKILTIMQEVATAYPSFSAEFQLIADKFDKKFNDIQM